MKKSIYDMTRSELHLFVDDVYEAKMSGVLLNYGTNLLKVMSVHNLPGCDSEYNESINKIANGFIFPKNIWDNIELVKLFLDFSV